MNSIDSATNTHDDCFDANAICVDGAVIVYRLYDVGYAIRLDEALPLLASNAAERVRPIREDTHAIHIVSFPVSVLLAIEQLPLRGTVQTIQVSARLFDFGVCSLQACCTLAQGSTWNDFQVVTAELGSSAALSALFVRHLDSLCSRVGPAIERAQRSDVVEDFVLCQVRHLTNMNGEPVSPEALPGVAIASLLLKESRPLATLAQNTLLSHRFAYFDDDLTVLSWESALVIEPDLTNADIAYVLEFANAQLLELRVYDALLDAELPAMYERAVAARTARLPLGGTNLRRTLTQLHTRVADITEPIERVENALKVTDDVYLARIYMAALDLFRERVWRAGIDRKLTIMRDTYTMLTAEAQAMRSEFLEVIVVVLILAELAMGIVHR
jgi:hypothetical protein